MKMMKRNRIFPVLPAVAVRLLVLPVFFLAAAGVLRAQGTVNELTNDFQGRISAGIDKKIVKGLHVSLDAEARYKDNFSTLGRLQADLNLSYKPLPWLKTSIGYVFMENHNASDEWKMRHRVYVDLTGILDLGDWRLSLKERLQLTHKDVNNTHKHVPNLLELKSRFKVSYRGWRKWRPYAYVEMRNCFNEPSWKATWTGSSYVNSSFLGYDSAYINRVRGALGVEWRINKHNSIDFHAMADYCYEKNISTKNSQQSLKSLTWDRGINAIFAVGYQFSF